VEVAFAEVQAENRERRLQGKIEDKDRHLKQLWWQVILLPQKLIDDGLRAFTNFPHV
jgi:hypothetical protein